MEDCLFIPKWTPVLLTWDDAHGGDDGWKPPSAILHHHKPKRMYSVGFLLRDDSVGTTITFSRSKGRSQVGEYLFVAAPMVVSVRPLS